MNAPVTTQYRRRVSSVAGEDGQSAEDRISRALEEYAAAIERGEQLSREELLADYADVGAEVAGCLDSLDFIRQVAPQLSDDGGGGAKHGGTFIRPLATLGDFRIVRELGRGGMGVVYEAEQLSLGRRVALKVLPFAAMLDKQQLNRFKNEARAAATLDHPNIVAIHSVGAERGVHYYAMQLIEGHSLADVIASMKPGRPLSAVDAPRSHPLPAGEGRGEDVPSTAADSARAALPTVRAGGSAAFSSLPPFESRDYYRAVAQLGIQAAEALDHAHQNGILHRDIKPANLLVDDAGKLWITDFGLARIEQDAGMTMTGDLLGTLRYMSPEQALAKRVVVDHRSDIYSLGVTLYELLALEPPYDGADRQELLKKIAFEEPKRLRQRDRRIPEDIETVVAKAIEKSPDDRFAIAMELADDLRRFVDGHAIKATSPNVPRRLLKWLRRNPRIVGAAGIAMLLAVITTMTVSLVIWRQMEQTSAALEKAEHERSRAEAAAAESKALADFFIQDLLGSADPARTDGQKLTVEQVLENADRKIEAGLANQPLLEVAIRRAIAQIETSLGNFERAEQQLRRARAIQSHQEVRDRDVIDTETELAAVCFHEGRYDETNKLLMPLIEKSTRLFGPDDEVTMGLMCIYGNVLICQNRIEEAGKIYKKVFEVANQKFGPEDQKTLAAKFNLAVFYNKKGDFGKAGDLFQQVLRTQERVIGPDNSETSMTASFLARVRLNVGNYDESIKLYERAVNGFRRIYGPDHPNVRRSVDDLASARRAQAWFPAKLGRFREAAGLCQSLARTYPDDLQAAEEAALLSLLIGDHVAHATVCRQLLERFSTNMDPAIARRVSLSCLISDPPVGDVDLLLRLADHANQINEGEEAMRARQVRGLAAYRAGQSKPAIKWCAESDGLTDKGRFHAQNLLIESLAMYRLGKKSEAKTKFEDAVTTAGQYLPPPNAGFQKFARTSFDWVLFELLRREAASLQLGDNSSAKAEQ